MQTPRTKQLPGISWRVGVHPRLLGGTMTAAEMRSTAVGDTLAVKAAVLHMEVVDTSEDLQLCMHLHRADGLTGIIEVDQDGRICKAGCCPLHRPGGWAAA
jgi:hypothetical protein